MGELFLDPAGCSSADTRFRHYFPKFPNKHVGGYEESYIDGLYFQHVFRSGLALMVIMFAVCFCAIAVIIFIYWWRKEGDLVGSSNIAAFILAVGAFWLGIGALSLHAS